MLELSQVCKSYSPLEPVVSNLSFRLEAKQLLAILGPSGCGKTTTLRLIAGLERPDSGQIRFGSQLWSSLSTFVAPEQRKIGLVFQDYALFPHLDVLRNVLFGLQRVSKKESLVRAREMLERVGLTGLEGRFPHQLSGGQQQRVALARSLAPDPQLLLLDEPFSGLDAALRTDTRAEVRELLLQSQIPAILVTHDQHEALSFADQIVVMRAGRLEQHGTPQAVYHHPKSAFVARFLGKSNLIGAEAHGPTAQSCLGSLELSISSQKPIQNPIQGKILLSVRPEDLSFAESGTPARIIYREFQGAFTMYTCLLESASTPQEIVVQSKKDWLEVGLRVHLVVTGAVQVLDQGVSLEG